MTIKAWPINERPREKLLQKGAAALSDAELFAIVLRTGIKNKSVVELARELLQHLGGFRGIFHTNIKTLCERPGMSITKFAELQAILEICKRYLKEGIAHKDLLKNNLETRIFLKSQLRDAKKEIFSILFLDAKNHVIAYEEMAHGTLNFAHIYPREILRQVLHYNAAGVILAHNHPSGFVEPSQADYLVTKQLQKALELFQVELLDHIIIGENQYFSFREQNLF